MCSCSSVLREHLLIDGLVQTVIAYCRQLLHMANKETLLRNTLNLYICGTNLPCKPFHASVQFRERFDDYLETRVGRQDIYDVFMTRSFLAYWPYKLRVWFGHDDYRLRRCFDLSDSPAPDIQIWIL